MVIMTRKEYLDSLCDDEIIINYRDAKRRIMDEIVSLRQEEELDDELEETLQEGLNEASHNIQ
jgi:hypothetical protein